ncbi:pyruvate, phosphate dikinase [Reyranella sp.]|jgi:pyruvate,orthophosphate dikinase|uniref:pyruvate, phosphate dikinase n=1 Tax=Reyranella sp. TaxID=1929291 RepID=UPI000BD51915|nr:pyruvate, phosphate dikinase [Reyranella sp.]OYY40274.1 MAG: pyruvate, phosphate dikinase [Rhodospirillales bacterium 35-66-84]OYZ92826.1 MAG: pyruvate, phosphate dikinase [Rhodospirillales bacterium 24-66-33]OZB22547.1 MAG: pyruvate, phosphate dikinase [Rhodospirillales bacterium 39-66-50]HQS18932.1 pyruvate, phosphate dikinase [Reyranella sp.]HQT12299.1 pyruvate, phosphate dikinase [Reyranella sp.]
MAKWVYSFGDGKAEGRADMRNLLGGKGANLAEMSSLGLPVPPGFTITTELCTHFYDNKKTYPPELKDEVEKALAEVEKIVGTQFGDAANPLLVSVRSGARASMPGMMDTVLNLGLNDKTVLGLAKSSGDERFAWDSYRRFIQMYSNVVLDVGHHYFEEALEIKKEDLGVSMDTDLKAEDWRAVVAEYKKLVEKRTGKPFPQEPREQLWGAVGAVFDSWMNQRAITYRRLHAIPESWGTAVNVQAMVFGNMGEDCATGVAFTRDPSTGTNLFYGEYLVNAQGEDVVAGIRTPQHLTVQGKLAQKSDAPAMEEVMPEVFKQLDSVRQRLERHYHDMQDIEFTVQRGKLYMLQTRNGKRTAKAALKIAVDMVHEGLIDKREAVSRIVPASLDQLLHPTLDPKAPRKVIAKGLPASPGAASGKVVFTADDAEKQARAGEKVILVRRETSPEDIHGMHAAEGILTSTGGMTSHAAVVARGMGKPCVAGAGDVRIDGKAGTLSVRGTVVKTGDTITLDGSTGEIILGVVPTVQPELSGDFSQLMEWADEFRKLGIRTNAETPTDAAQARKFGAEGIGLCRTEHMFFEGDRIVAVRQMILADDETSRRAALAKIQPMQRQDFVELFEIMAGLPVTIRLLDPPLHEFLPKTAAEMEVVAKDLGVDVKEIEERANKLHEFNPMLGHRGVRLGISYPEIYEMQARAIFEAVAEVQKKAGKTVIPEIMIPLVATKKELDLMKVVIDQVAEEVSSSSGQKLEYLVGTMIELPRAALRAGDIAESAEFFSFGTNDLTQTTFGLSRDDSASFLEKYQQRGIFEHDPFASLDIEGVGELIEIATERGRKVRNSLKLGICGEHGGDPASVFFCHKAGLDYVSCSPYRVPIARLAAAQAALGGPLKTE